MRTGASGRDMGSRIRVYARRVTAQHDMGGTRPGTPVPRRHRVDAAGFVDEQAEWLDRARRRRAAPGRARAHQRLRRQALPGRVLLVGPPGCRRASADEATALCGLRLPRAAARQRAGPRRLHGRLRRTPWPARHTPCVRAAAPRARLVASPEQYGASAAILLGDLLLSWSDELLRTCGLPAERVSTALGYFDLTRSEVVTGQFLDVSAQARGEADVDTAMTVLRYKSAKYSIERPLHIGAALAGRRPSRSPS